MRQRPSCSGGSTAAGALVVGAMVIRSFSRTDADLTQPAAQPPRGLVRCPQCEPRDDSQDDADEHVVVRPVGASPGRDAKFTAFVLDHRATLLRAAWLLVGDAYRAEDEIVGHAGS